MKSQISRTKQYKQKALILAQPRVIPSHASHNFIMVWTFVKEKNVPPSDG